MDCFVAQNENAPRNDGFTLAEVLITLVIIGVIAAITVPNMLHKYKNEELATKFKKAYSVLSNALTLAQSKNGPLTTWDWNSDGFDIVENYIVPELQVMKNCRTSNEEQCATHSWYKANGDFFYTPVADDRHYIIVLNDGMQIVFYKRGNCIQNRTQCLDMHVDTNGSKTPNVRGKDVFSFYVYPFTNDVVIGGVRETPYNIETKSWPLSSLDDIEENCRTNGFACGAKIIKEGYKINF